MLCLNSTLHTFLKHIFIKICKLMALSICVHLSFCCNADCWKLRLQLYISFYCILSYLWNYLLLSWVDIREENTGNSSPQNFKHISFFNTSLFSFQNKNLDVFTEQLCRAYHCPHLQCKRIKRERATKYNHVLPSSTRHKTSPSLYFHTDVHETLYVNMLDIKHDCH